jgi:hypothetical protein
VTHVETLQNGRGRTALAPASEKSQPRATDSPPISDRNEVRRRVSLAVTEFWVTQGLSVALLAAGVNTSTVRRVERGCATRIDTLTRLANGLGVPVARLVAGDRAVH